MEEIDVFDFNNALAEFISGGLRKYIVENKKAVFPTAPPVYVSWLRRKCFFGNADGGMA